LETPTPYLCCWAYMMGRWICIPCG
jgi:hypothetical protein